MINKLIVKIQMLSRVRFYTRFYPLPIKKNRFTNWLFGESSYCGNVGILIPSGLNKKG